MPYDPQKHHRRSIRLKGYDYTQPGAYFVTLVTYQRESLFGEIIAGEDGKNEMRLSPVGQIVREEWLRSNALRREIRLYEDEFVVMPNHMHGIVWFVEEDISEEGGARCAPRLEAPQTEADQTEVGLQAGSVGVEDMRAAAFRRTPRSLGAFVAGFKATVTSRAWRELDINGIWQRNYYEHIIRTDQEFTKIWEYIDSNPQRWQDDSLHPDPQPKRIQME